MAPRRASCVATMHDLLRASDRAGVTPASSTQPPSGSSARAAARRRSRATAAFRARSAPRRTRWSCTASPARYRLKEGDIISLDIGVTLDGWVADAARTFAVGEIDAQPRNAAARDRGGAARGRRAVPCRQPHGRHLERDPARRRGRRALGRALARRPRRGAQHARGPAGPELRPARQGAAAGGGDGARGRADDDGRTRRRCGSPATAGRSTRRTARRRRTSSSRSRSPATARGS